MSQECYGTFLAADPPAFAGSNEHEHWSGLGRLSSVRQSIWHTNSTFHIVTWYFVCSKCRCCTPKYVMKNILFYFILFWSCFGFEIQMILNRQVIFVKMAPFFECFV
jgi:hypothetical protein